MQTIVKELPQRSTLQTAITQTQTHLEGEDSRLDMLRLWLDADAASAQGAGAQVLNAMQQHGWSILLANAAPRADNAHFERGVHAVMVGKLSRHHVG